MSQPFDETKVRRASDGQFSAKPAAAESGIRLDEATPVDLGTSRQVLAMAADQMAAARRRYVGAAMDLLSDRFPGASRFTTASGAAADVPTHIVSVEDADGKTLWKRDPDQLGGEPDVDQVSVVLADSGVLSRTVPERRWEVPRHFPAPRTRNGVLLSEGMRHHSYRMSHLPSNRRDAR